MEVPSEDVVATISLRLDELESSARADRPRMTVREFWELLNEIDKELCGLPSLENEDTLRLESRVRRLRHEFRQRQKEFNRQVAGKRAALEDRLKLMAETLHDAIDIDAVQAVRADLHTVRTQLNRRDDPLPRRDRVRVWEMWQSLNHDAWQRLNSLWAEHTAVLRSRLVDINDLIEAGNVKGAKAELRAINRMLGLERVPRQARAELQAFASALWTKTEYVARQKREDYLRNLESRNQYWKAQLRRNEMARRGALAEIARLERQARDISTQVAIALVHGQINERRRALTQLERDARELQSKISDADARLAGRTFTGREQG